MQPCWRKIGKRSNPVSPILWCFFLVIQFLHTSSRFGSVFFFWIKKVVIMLDELLFVTGIFVFYNCSTVITPISLCHRPGSLGSSCMNSEWKTWKQGWWLACLMPDTWSLFMHSTTHLRGQKGEIKPYLLYVIGQLLVLPWHVASQM